MPCEFQVVSKAKAGPFKLVACGRRANYFQVRGELGKINLWLCVRHENRCQQIYHWELKQLQPPEVEV